MMEGTTIVALHTLVSVLGLWILLFWLYRDYRVDRFRQRMFKLRDRLFDEALDENISFENEGYRAVRRSMNGFIRFGHRLSLLQVLLFWGSLGNFSEDDDSGTDGDFDDAIDRQNYETRELLGKYRLKMNLIVIEHLILGSPLLVLMIVPASVGYVAVRRFGAIMVAAFRNPLDKLDDAALNYGG